MIIKDNNLEDSDLQLDKIGPQFRKAREAKNMILEQFYGPITEHISNCSAIENGKRRIGKRLSKDIIDYHCISMEWLKTGKGEMFVDEPAGELSAAAHSRFDKGVPFFNVDLSEIRIEETSLFREPPEYYVNFRPFNDCDAYLPIYGDSMYPKYAGGDVIAVREIRNFDVIQWGEPYLVVADSRANNITTVKLLFEHFNNDKIILRSSNPNFKGDTVIDKEFIVKLFIVKGKVSRNQL